MRLYPKRLNGLEDLKREKQILSYIKKQTEDEDFFPKIQLGSKKSSKGIFSVISSLLSSESGLEKGIALAGPLMGLFKSRRNKKKAKEEYRANKEPHKNVFKSFLIGFVTGYLKWKAIEAAAKLIINFIKSRKKDSDKAQSSPHH
ncbi:MAG TPA: hypothetical protein VN721_15310 [Flavipsychrobacter sp.]|nr:hypothetical protein [Flavipsychrobacter sp.]